jgi:hypothetical protein
VPGQSAGGHSGADRGNACVCSSDWRVVRSTTEGERAERCVKRKQTKGAAGRSRYDDVTGRSARSGPGGAPGTSLLVFPMAVPSTPVVSVPMCRPILSIVVRAPFADPGVQPNGIPLWPGSASAPTSPRRSLPRNRQTPVLDLTGRPTAAREHVRGPCSSVHCAARPGR